MFFIIELFLTKECQGRIYIYIRPSMVISMTTNVFHEQKRAYIYVLVL